MDVVGSEIGQKMRSAIKAKLTELGCYVDDELPDYVMVMVANKRTRAQMEDDLQLFLGDNTELFVNWLHQVLKKLQEVTVTPSMKPTEREKSKDKERPSSKDRSKSKDKKLKDKTKKSEIKKAKKKEKEKNKLHKKKEQKKSHKKPKSKHHDIIRPNIPPLLMNMEKNSEPSITDVFAGQILKNHGILIETQEDIKETKPNIQEIKRPILPIIDPATILAEPSASENVIPEANKDVTNVPREEQIKEITEIETQIQGLKQKLVEQLDNMSDDEDFLNIRTEAEELMNDFAEDVFQEISQAAPKATPPIPPPSQKPVVQPSKPVAQPAEAIPSQEATKTKPVEPPKDNIETLPQIELKLPKRPLRERISAPEQKKVKEKEVPKVAESPERYTPEREPETRPQVKTAKSRLGDPPEPQKKHSTSEDPVDKPESSSKRLTSKVSSLAGGAVGRCASVVRVRPRVRQHAPASALLLRAVADAHKSLLNIPPKVEHEPQKVKRALVLPMRRTVEAQKIVIQVPVTDAPLDEVDATDTISLGEPDSDDDKSSKVTSDNEKEEYVPVPITKMIHNTDYTPSRRNECRKSTKKDDTLIIETINIHNPTVDKDKNTQFIVTMDGYHPNAFLAKKLETEGLLEDEEISKTLKIPTKSAEKAESKDTQETPKTESSDESAKEIIIKQEVVENSAKSAEKRKIEAKQEEVQVKKRKPIVFDVDKKETDRERKRTESASSDNHVIVTTVGTHKYDAIPPLSTVTTERKPPPIWCRAFPQCRYGSACAFQHPRCKFAAACTRRNCPYSHALTAPAAVAPSPVVASHVVPAANFKSITATLPAICKFYPACVNPACHFYHPKPCRYGKNCANKLDCNFYHADKWFPV